MVTNPMSSKPTLLKVPSVYWGTLLENGGMHKEIRWTATLPLIAASKTADTLYFSQSIILLLLDFCQYQSYATCHATWWTP